MIATLALFSIAEPASTVWRRADTDNFIVYSDGSANQWKELATDLERFDALIKQLLGVRRETDPVRLPIYFVRNAERVAILLGDGERRIVGAYFPSEEGSFVLRNREWDNRENIPGRVVLFREYAHHLM